ncbi:MAG TPA: hypothetical protein VH307_28220 [Streptosporangiaceae bacterium]|jgi:hypothetical protein|nr:hypothetical protein [Streptosporangiaceae bacterium]
MESKPKERVIVEHPVEIETETTETSRPKRRKAGWKSLLAVAIVIVIVWQLYHAFIQGGKTSNAGSRSQQPGATGTAPPTPKPTPTPTVTLGGHPVSAASGPVIILNPGLVAPGGKVGVVGSGFSPHAAVVVSLVLSGSRTGTVVARTGTSKWGGLYSGFTMPASLVGGSATVVAKAANGQTATAKLVTPGGVGSVKIVGKAAGPPGSTVTVSATGFGPGEKIHVFWGRVAGTPASILTAGSNGDVSASVPVGVAPVGPTTLVLVGTRTQTTATAAYQMIGMYPTTVMHPWAVKAGHPVGFTGSGFVPGEQVLIFLNSTGGMPALTTTAGSTGAFRIGFIVPFGLKGKQSLTAVGNQSRAATTSGFSVLPYMPQAQASTYGAMPGTTVSFYVKGFAANEVVLVYTGGGSSGSGKLVTAFRVNSNGSAAAAGTYVIPSNVQGALHFSLVGQKSGGTAGIKFAVTGGSGVTVPPQPPYVLPPSLGGKAPARSPNRSASPSPGSSSQRSSSPTGGASSSRSAGSPKPSR